MKWKKPQKYHVESQDGCFVISKSSVNGEWKYVAWRKRSGFPETIQICDNAPDAKKACDEFKKAEGTRGAERSDPGHRRLVENGHGVK